MDGYPGSGRYRISSETMRAMLRFASQDMQLALPPAQFIALQKKLLPKPIAKAGTARMQSLTTVCVELTCHTSILCVGIVGELQTRNT